MAEIVYRLAKSTGTHGDIFAAVGLADLMAGLLPEKQKSGVAIVDTGGRFAVRLPASADYARLSPAPGYPFLKANEKTRVPPGAQDVVDYKQQKAKADRLKQLKAELQKKKNREPELQQLIQQDEPREDWRLLQVLNVLQGDETSNRIHEAIVRAQPATFRKLVGSAVDAMAAGKPSGVDWPAGAVQLFTPNVAKGFNRLKPDSTSRAALPDQPWTDSFLEWMKYRGYFLVACPFFQGSKAEHVRLLCPVPADITVSALAAVARNLRNSRIYGGPPKMDSLAVLQLAELLVRHSQEYHDAETEPYADLSLLGKSPADLISGLTVTHYQSMGSSKAVSTMFTLALPGWFPLSAAEDAARLLEILGEHQRVLRGLQDDHSDEIGLLIGYRRFLEMRGEAAVWALIGFMEQYGPFLIRARGPKRKLTQFRTDLFERILMGVAFKPTEILNDPGFQAVAAAIRRATVSAQAQNAMNKEHREIRYDLLHDLRRTRSLPGIQPLLEKISDFVSKYNVENARRREMGKPAPRNVTTEEFAALAALIEKHGASIVGALLCAYGACREPSEQEAGREPAAAVQAG